MRGRLEAGPVTLSQLLATSAVRLAARPSPAKICLTTRPSPAKMCDQLLQAAAAGSGPAGVSNWQDDRTVFVFAVEAPG